MLKIDNLSVNFGDKELLHDININVATGARHLLCGHNGSGKTTLVRTIAGLYPLSGKIIFDDTDITEMPTDERARLGIFFGLQHVPEIPGLSLTSFLKHSLMAKNPDLKPTEFFMMLSDAKLKLGIPESWMGRAVNTGFSGGERKRIQMLHMILMQPRLAILDEPDSGVDAETQKLFANIILEMSRDGTTFLIISHQEKFTEMISPTATTVLENGRIVI